MRFVPERCASWGDKIPRNIRITHPPRAGDERVFSVGRYNRLISLFRSSLLE